MLSPIENLEPSQVKVPCINISVFFGDEVVVALTGDVAVEFDVSASSEPLHVGFRCIGLSAFFVVGVGGGCGDRRCCRIGWHV